MKGICFGEEKEDPNERRLERRRRGWKTPRHKSRVTRQMAVDSRSKWTLNHRLDRGNEFLLLQLGVLFVDMICNCQYLLVQAQKAIACCEMKRVLGLI